MYYIQETDKPNFIFNKLNIIKLKDDKIKLPTNGQGPMPLKKALKLAKKTNKILSETNSKKIVLSKNIKKEEAYVNELYSYNLEIVDGRWLFEAISYKILEYISKKKELKEQESRNINIGKRLDRKHIRKFKNDNKKI